MKTKQNQKEKSLEFEASIGMDEKDFSGEIDQFQELHKALNAVVKKFSGSGVPCNFSLEGKRPITWNFYIDEEDIENVLEKLEKLERGFSDE